MTETAADERPLARGRPAPFVVWLVRRAVPSVLFRAAVTGRVPMVGRHYRWFMRQQYLAPRQSVTFVGFAERLTTGWRNGEEPDQVNKLLVHALLEDLRCAYSRRPWRLAGWRRTAYPVLLLADVALGNAGYTLMRLLNDVRNETGRTDPLLVIGGQRRATGGGHRGGRPVVPAGRGARRLRGLAGDAARAAPAARPDAWHLVYTVEDEPTDVVGAGPDLAQPDIAQPDIAQPDLAQPDFTVP